MVSTYVSGQGHSMEGIYLSASPSSYSIARRRCTYPEPCESYHRSCPFLSFIVPQPRADREVSSHNSTVIANRVVSSARAQLRYRYRKGGT
ncbi:hypothetical protein NKDENANG_01609 [Candidatus Entotheonellaceae bacterium PAL068K]